MQTTKKQVVRLKRTIDENGGVNEVALKAKLSHSTVSGVVSGYNRSPKLATLIAIEQTCGVEFFDSVAWEMIAKATGARVPDARG